MLRDLSGQRCPRRWLPSKQGQPTSMS